MSTFTDILRGSPYESGLNQAELELRINRKNELRKALRYCTFGDKAAKIYVKDYIKDILVKKYGVSKDSIDFIIPFSQSLKLTAQDRFEILLYIYQKDYDNKALEELIKDYSLDKPKKDKEGMIYYEITKEDIHMAFDTSTLLSLNFNDKLNILAQRIYQRYKGNGSIDEIRDMKIDGVSAGVSGIPEGFELDNVLDIATLPASYDSIWIFYHGKTIHLSFLSFHSYKELVRVCKNIYRYNNPGQLSEVKGYIVNEMKDGSRVAVARPPFCESWVLFVRKFDAVLQENIRHLITDENKELPINIMKWLIKGCRVIGITGEQGSGKTTLLMSLIGFINPSYNLRIQELSFELHLRKIYPNRNIVTFRETGSITGQEGLNFQKKTDGAVNILGEVASAPVSAWLIQMAQVASLFTLFTHHAKTTADLVISMRNSLLLEGGFHNERIATEQVSDTINFDIHMKKGMDGHRYIERITEIIPSKEGSTESSDLTKGIFGTRDIIVWNEGSYVWKNPLSSYSKKNICNYLNEKEKGLFSEDMGAGWSGDEDIM